MKKILLPALALNLLILAGCEIFYEPVIVNKTNIMVELEAAFSDGSAYSLELDPGMSFRQRQQGLSVEWIAVSANEVKKTFNQVELRDLIADEYGEMAGVIHIILDEHDLTIMRGDQRGNN